LQAIFGQHPEWLSEGRLMDKKESEKPT
jgi:hypothetical protein